MDIGQISSSEIRRALEHLRQARSLAGNALLGSELVSARLAQEGLTDTTESRTWVLAGLLETIVRGNLAAARGGADEPEDEAITRSLEATRDRIRADFDASDPDRESWSCLYYRYFSRHDFHVNELAAIGRPGSRHGRKFVSRRVSRGIGLVGTILREMELGADPSAALPGTTGTGEGPSPAVGEADRVPSRPRGGRHNLPAQASRFVGRADELAALIEAFSSARAVTLTGTGGAGKTRLALELAANLRDADGIDVWLVELAGLETPDLLPEAIADVLGIEHSGGHAPLIAIREAIGERELLLVLDNCEHLVDRAAEVASELLSQAPGLRVLATSREPLNIDGEQLWPVAPLPVPPRDAWSDVTVGERYASVALFVDRAHSADPSFALREENRATVCELCARLDGLPLAIELAAARVRSLPPERILARIAQRFTVLGRGRRGADARQRTLWAAIEWSYALLEPSEQRLLQRLSVFRDGWTLAAAEQVCEDSQDTAGVGPDLLADLSSLVDKSLVLSKPMVGDDEQRFDLLESIRAFAGIKLLEAGEHNVLGHAHLCWCDEMARSGASALRGREQEAWLSRLAREAENFRHALEWALESVEDAPMGLRLATSLTSFWRLRGRPSEGRLWLQRFLSTEVGRMTGAERAAALDGLGSLAFQQGDYAAARSYHEESLEIHRQQGDLASVAESLRHLGNVADESGAYQEAESRYEDALQIWRDLEGSWGIAATLNNLGLVHLRTGELQAAQRYLEESLVRFEELGTDWAMGVTQSNLGDVALAKGNGHEARERMAASLAVARRLDDQEGMAYALTGMAHAECLLDNLIAARRLLGESLVALERMGSQAGKAEWLEVAALYLQAEGSAQDAVQVHAAAAALRVSIETPLPPKDREAKAAALDELRGRLGPDEFGSLWSVGSTLRPQDAAMLTLTRD